jgi:hypothetical protein
MSNGIVKPPPQTLDNFGAFDDSVEGDDSSRPVGGMLVGTRLKFTNSATWVSVTGDDYTDHVLLAANVRRMEIKWINDRPAPESRELQAGEKFDDLDALNELCPRSEWRDSFGKMKGPWERQYILEFANLESMARFSWPTSTIGGGIAVRELIRSINLKRQFENRNDLWPFVKLSHCNMRTSYDPKGRERPDCKITSWYSPPKNEAALAAEPTQPQLSSSAFEPVTAPQSLAEEMKDEIPFK